MRVHHLNAGTMRPPLIGRLVCHVLLVEHDAGPVVVDTGLGQADLARPAARLGPGRALLRPAYDPAEPVVVQLAARGIDPTEVRHVVLTHLDLDHAGGLADLPHATVHTTAAEHAAATAPPTLAERQRYRSSQWAHGPHVRTHDGPGEAWHGFPGAHELPDLPGIVLVPLPGHTRGHAAVAVDAGRRGWILHAGDAFFDRGTIAAPTDPRRDRAPRRLLTAFEQVMAFDRRRVRDNHARLAELHAGDDEVTVVCAHDPVQFDRAVAITT